MRLGREQIYNWAKRAAITLAGLIVFTATLITWLLYDRPRLSDIDWLPYPEYEARADAVTVTWLGVATLLFDDGDTQLLIDGFFSRPSIGDMLFRTNVQSNAAQINRIMDEFEMRRLTAIIPVHSHFDHAMDIGAIANRSSASILGSESTANIARGAGVPEDQIVVAEAGVPYTFGNFTVTLILSNHAPIGWAGSTPLDGTIDAPLNLPAPINAWRAGPSYSIVVAHAEGTALVQGSAGFAAGALDDVVADVVLLGSWGIESLGREYAQQYWQALVTSTGARRILPIHFDDYTRPFGRTELSPRVLDNFVDTAAWLDEIRSTWDSDARLHLPEFGQRLVLYPPATPDT